jgi:hypothetical protein
MGDAVMPTISGRSIITNRQLNFTLSPVDLHNKKVMPYKLSNYAIDGTWNQHQSIILDVILDRIFRGFYRGYKKLPQSWRSKKAIDVVKKFSRGKISPTVVSFMNMPPREAYIEKSGWDIIGAYKEEYDYFKERGQIEISLDELIDRKFEHDDGYKEFLKENEENFSAFSSDYPIRINFLEMLDAYPFLDDYRYNFKTHLKKVAETKFQMNYKIKYVEQEPTYNDSGKMDGRGRMIDIHYKMHDYQNLFDVDIDKSKILLNFNTPLGKFVIHNTLLLDTDWCPYEALSLSKNAYFLFKRFVISKRMGKYKSKEIMLSFEEIKSFLDLNSSLERHDNKIIVDALRDMERNSLMKSFNAIKRAGKRRYELRF